MKEAREWSAIFSWRTAAEQVFDIYRRLLGIVGAAGYLAPTSPGAALAGRIERTARHAQINTIDAYDPIQSAPPPE